MRKRVLAGLVAGIASAVLVASPSLALNDPGVLEEINSTGGTTTSDGLHLQFARGQMQVLRDGAGQLCCDSNAPDPTQNLDGTVLGNNFVVVFNDGSQSTLYGDSTNYEPGTPAALTTVVPWDSFTSESTLTDNGQSGVVIVNLKDANDNVNVKLTYTYVYPNQWFNVKADLTVNSAPLQTMNHKMYWFADSTLGASDSGDQFNGSLTSGLAVAGVTSPDLTMIEAYRQVTGQSLNWFAGQYSCPFAGSPLMWNVVVGTLADCGGDTADGGWIAKFQDFPSVAATDTNIDNGFGVSSAAMAGSTDSISYDLIFASCVDGYTALQCADAASAPIDRTPSLPNTGVDAVTMTGFAAGAVALLALGGVLVAVRRRQV